MQSVRRRDDVKIKKIRIKSREVFDQDLRAVARALDQGKAIKPTSVSYPH